MKKLIIALGTLIVSTAALSAQGLFTFRAEAGAAFNFGKVMTDGQAALSAKNKLGYHLGAYIDVPVFNSLYVGSGLTFSMKGAKNEIDGLSSDITMHYLQVPINIGYKFSLSRTFALGLQTGPYFSFALAGTHNVGVKALDLAKSYNIFKDGISGLGEAAKAKRFDVGWGVAALGYFGNIYGTVGLDFGFLNVLNSSEKGSLGADVKDRLANLKNLQCHIGIGYCF